MPAARAPRDAEQLDPVAQLLGVADVLARQLRDALGVDLVELHRHAEGDRRHDGELVRGIDALDVERRVGLGVAARLRLLQHGVERRAGCAHLGQDEVRRAVDDAGDPLDPVGGEAFAQRLDDRNAAGDRALERDHHALRVRRGEDLVAVAGEQRLVRGDHVLAVGDRLQDERSRRLDAADQLDDDVDVGVREHDRGIGGEVDAGRTARQLARALDRALGDPGDPDRPPRAPRDLALRCGAAPSTGPVPTVPTPRRPTSSGFIDGVMRDARSTQAAGRAASTGFADVGRPRRLAAMPSSRNICLMPRIACRVRDSFSIIAKRT